MPLSLHYQINQKLKIKNHGKETHNPKKAFNLILFSNYKFYNMPYYLIADIGYYVVVVFLIVAFIKIYKNDTE